MNYNEIRAVYTEKTITVYQAYNSFIANEAVKKGTFGNNYKLNRMTWIKPSFLWMMYRCGWGTKENQECILAIEIKREAFDYLVRNAVNSTYQKTMYSNRDVWKNLINNSDIRCQWDPERDVYGRALDYRSIQIGLRGEAIKKYVNEWIINITDITEYVNELKQMLDNQQDISNFLPNERVYHV